MIVLVGVSIALLLCLVLVLIGCLDCLAKKNKFQAFGVRDSPRSQHNAAFTVDIFDADSYSDPVVIEPLPDILPKVSSAPAIRPRITCSDRGRQESALSILSVQRSFPRSHVTYLNEIGSGWFGKVIESEAVQIATGGFNTRVVVKILKDDATKQDQKQFLEEVNAFRSLDHANLLHLLGQCTETTPYLAILEFAAYGNLKSYLLQHRQDVDSLFTNQWLISLAVDAAAGLACLHRNEFIHNDLAARNCLVMGDHTLKIGDYGISDNLFKDEYFNTGTELLPIRWMAPETLILTDGTWASDKSYKSSDMWSFGILLWEIFSLGERPYDSLTDESVLQTVVLDRLLLPSDVSLRQLYRASMWPIMQQCWMDQSERPRVEQIHRALEQIKQQLALPVDLNFGRKWKSFEPNNAKEKNFVSDDRPSASHINVSGVSAFIQHVPIDEESPSCQIQILPEVGPLFSVSSNVSSLTISGQPLANQIGFGQSLQTSSRNVMSISPSVPTSHVSSFPVLIENGLRVTSQPAVSPDLPFSSPVVSLSEKPTFTAPFLSSSSSRELGLSAAMVPPQTPQESGSLTMPSSFASSVYVSLDEPSYSDSVQKTAVPELSSTDLSDTEKFLVDEPLDKTFDTFQSDEQYSVNNSNVTYLAPLKYGRSVESNILASDNLKTGYIDGTCTCDSNPEECSIHSSSRKLGTLCNNSNKPSADQTLENWMDLRLSTINNETTKSASTDCNSSIVSKASTDSLIFNLSIASPLSGRACFSEPDSKTEITEESGHFDPSLMKLECTDLNVEPNNAGESFLYKWLTLTKKEDQDNHLTAVTTCENSARDATVTADSAKIGSVLSISTLSMPQAEAAPHQSAGDSLHFDNFERSLPSDILEESNSSNLSSGIYVGQTVSSSGEFMEAAYAVDEKSCLNIGETKETLGSSDSAESGVHSQIQKDEARTSQRLTSEPGPSLNSSGSSQNSFSDESSFENHLGPENDGKLETRPSDFKTNLYRCNRISLTDEVQKDDMPVNFRDSDVIEGDICDEKVPVAEVSDTGSFSSSSDGEQEYDTLDQLSSKQPMTSSPNTAIPAVVEAEAGLASPVDFDDQALKIAREIYLSRGVKSPRVFEIPPLETIPEHQPMPSIQEDAKTPPSDSSSMEVKYEDMFGLDTLEYDDFYGDSPIGISTNSQGNSQHHNLYFREPDFSDWSMDVDSVSIASSSSVISLQSDEVSLNISGTDHFNSKNNLSDQSKNSSSKSEKLFSPQLNFSSDSGSVFHQGHTSWLTSSTQGSMESPKETLVSSLLAQLSSPVLPSGVGANHNNFYYLTDKYDLETDSSVDAFFSPSVAATSENLVSRPVVTNEVKDVDPLLLPTKLKISRENSDIGSEDANIVSE